MGADAASELARRWGLSRARGRFKGLVSAGQAGEGGPPVTVLVPRTYMNESGESVGPARGALRVPLDRVVVLHDDIDLPFGEVRTRLGGGLAGHNGLRSVAAHVGGPDFWRVRIGVGRPESTDPETVSAYVLGRFAEPSEEVSELIARAAEEADRLLREIASERAPRPSRTT